MEFNNMKKEDILKMVVPSSFDEDNQTYHGHLYKREINDFCKKINILKPHHSCYQAFVSTGKDLEDGKCKVSLTTISFPINPSENIIATIDEDTISQINDWFDQ